MLFEFDDFTFTNAQMKVIGVGGAGGNIINRMIDLGLEGVEFIAINTDAQALERNKAQIKIQIGKNITFGHGTGAKEFVGQQAIEMDKDKVASVLSGAHLVFITAGMGGGTGTGAAPIVAQLAREQGILTVGVVTKPFEFEGRKRMERAEKGIIEMRNNCDTLIIIPNQKLLSIIDRSTTIDEAFKQVDLVLYRAVKGITDLINKCGLINLDFADLTTIMKDMGEAIMGLGIARGEERAALAAQQAISNPLLEDTNIREAKGLIINVMGKNIGLNEINEACEIIQRETNKDAEVIVGYTLDENLTDEIMITVIATGFNSKTRTNMKKPEPEEGPAIFVKPTKESVKNTPLLKDENNHDLFEKAAPVQPPAINKEVENYELDEPSNFTPAVPVNNLPNPDIPAWIRKAMLKKNTDNNFNR